MESSGAFKPVRPEQGKAGNEQAQAGEAGFHQAVVGVGLALAAFLIWGLSPLYWKQLAQVPAFEILMHRMVWSFFFLVPLLAIRRQGGEFLSALRSPKRLLVLLVTAFLVSANWFVYIWAVNENFVLQTSLGYYINPLFMVFLGLVFLRERLRRAQVIALSLAVVAVLYQTVLGGEFPWIALSLALSFSSYGLVRKMIPVRPLVGLTVETLLLFLPSAGYLVWLYLQGAGAFLRHGLSCDLLLMGSALLTALPLLLFHEAAKKLHLATVGIIQYSTPTCTFFLAVFVFQEAASPARMLTFALIWAALTIYSADSVLFYKKYRHTKDRFPSGG